MGGDPLDRGEDRLFGGGASQVGVRQVEVDTGRRGELTTDERAELKALQRENRELRRANEIPKKASAYFAQAELDRRPK
jgi:transposase